MNYSAIVLCAGSGTRAQLGYNKVHFQYKGKALFEYAIQAFVDDNYCNEIIVVYAEGERDIFDALYSTQATVEKTIKLVVGGEIRQESVANGVSAVENSIVFIHDSARRYIEAEDLHKLFKALELNDAALLGLPVVDTVKQQQTNGSLTTLNRDTIYLAQTPQAFHTAQLRDILDRAKQDIYQVTDEITLLEHYIEDAKIKIIPGKSKYSKWTKPEDFLKETKMNIRIGQSTDIHQIEQGRKLVLGGVEIESTFGLKGHSDADVLLHAVTEAIIGAMGLGDIGTHFPDTDPKYKGIDSKQLLAETIESMKVNAYEIGNIDSIVMTEAPKLAPYIQSMRETIARLCEVEVSQINVKATRGEKMGFIGRGEGMQAHAVVLLQKK